MNEKFLEDYLQVMELNPSSQSPPDKAGKRSPSKTRKPVAESTDSFLRTPTQKPDRLQSGSSSPQTPRPAPTTAAKGDWKQDLAAFSIEVERKPSSHEQPEPELLDRLRNQRDSILKQPRETHPQTKPSADLPLATAPQPDPRLLTKKYDYHQELEQLILEEYKAAFNTGDPPADLTRNQRAALTPVAASNKVNHDIQEPFLEDEPSNPFFLPMHTGAHIFQAGLSLRSKKHHDAVDSRHPSKPRDPSDSQDAVPRTNHRPASPISTGVYFESKSRNAPPKTASKTRANLSRLDSSKEGSLLSRSPSPNQVFGRLDPKTARPPAASKRDQDQRRPESRSVLASDHQLQPIGDLERWTAEISNIVIPDDAMPPAKRQDLGLHYNSQDLDKTIANDLTVLGLRDALKNSNLRHKRSPRSPEEDLETTRERAVAVLPASNMPHLSRNAPARQT